MGRNSSLHMSDISCPRPTEPALVVRLCELAHIMEVTSETIYRRTTATLVERAAGLTIASRLLGHANEMVTRNSYVITAEQVDLVTADILDTILGT